MISLIHKDYDKYNCSGYCSAKKNTISLIFKNNCVLEIVKYLKYLLSPFNSNFDSNMSKVLVLLFYSSRSRKQKDDILLSEPKIQNTQNIVTF